MENKLSNWDIMQHELCEAAIKLGQLRAREYVHYEMEDDAKQILRQIQIKNKCVFQADLRDLAESAIINGILKELTA